MLAYHPYLKRVAIVCLMLTGQQAPAQIRVGIQDYATLPTGTRMSVMTTDPNGRMFVNDQRGPIFTIDRSTRAVTPYLNLNTANFPSLGLVQGNAEAGVQSLAFHPDFYNTGTAGAGKFYTLHSSNNTTVTPDFDPGGGTAFHEVLLEWRTNNTASNTFVPADAAAPFREVARFKQPFGNHNGGLIAFNSFSPNDRGNLYVALGDGGSAGDPQNNGQNAGNPYGAVLRINPTGNNSANGKYGIVPGNAFASDGLASTLAENYAIGLRNPQRFGWDSQTGQMFIADIGQNAFEEINLGVNGGNYGWNVREGSQGGNLPGAIDPAAAYARNFVTFPVTASRAVTLGEVYRGGEIPELNGKLLLGDFPTGVIYTLDVVNDPLAGGSAGLRELTMVDENGQTVRLIDLLRRAPGLAGLSRADLRFSIGMPGEVFILNKHDGIVRRLVAVPEPTSGILITASLVALSFARRRTNSSKHGVLAARMNAN